ncbi:alpha/beta hydrolase [Caulobacter flavus]|uniref:Alpha/beta hydrolase n=1 Tax=Caulobacter flavus TaxID=1679497 RepID=A0A2N5CP65_9CAUL|nr:alpha/beta fold hydrolase [Caulobacter flavus]AYV48565.1 alpha/beta hydrolase [Caulobacter flavus]PLR08718.1 alpha/beta hydrolase [Caulobacter flavus]
MHDLIEPGWTLTHRAVNGLDLVVVEAGPADGAPVILLHGFPEFWWGWRRQIAALAQAGYRVIAPNLRGYAGSAAPKPVASYHLDILAADVLGLAKACGVSRFDLVAHDWGAVIAWRVLNLYPDLVARAVLMDGPHPDQLAAYAAAHPRQAARSAYVAMFQPPVLPELALRAFGYAALKASLRGSARPGTFSDRDLATYEWTWAQPGALSAMLNYYRALRLRRAQARPPAITTPVLVLWGQGDAFLEPGLARAALSLCQAGRLIVVPQAGHWLHLEQPAAVNAAILEFLGEGAETSGNGPGPPALVGEEADMSIKQQADQEIEASRDGDADLAFLLPEDQWDAFLSQTGAISQGDPPEATYRGVRFKRAPVTAIIHEEGF